MCFYFLCFDYTISHLAQSFAKPVVIKTTTSLRKTSFRKPSVKQSQHLFWSHGWFCSFSGFALPYLFPFYTGSWIIFTDQQIRVTRVILEKSYDSTMRVVVHFSRIFLSAHPDAPRIPPRWGQQPRKTSACQQSLDRITKELEGWINRVFQQLWCKQSFRKNVKRCKGLSKDPCAHASLP